MTASAARTRHTPRSLWLPAGAMVTAVYVAFIGLPLLALVIRAVLADGFPSSLTTPIAMRALRLSLLTSIASVVVIVLVGTPVAYLLARRTTRVLRTVDLLIEMPLVLPPVVAGVAMLMAFGRRGLLGGPLEAVGLSLPFTTAAVVFAQVFVAAPFFIRAAKIGFQSVDTELEEISQTLGHSPWTTFWRLTLPLSWPALAGGLALSWARALSEFGATIMFAGNFLDRTQTMPLAILTAMESDVAAALGLGLMLLVASAFVLVILGLVARARFNGPPGVGP
ncbi:MAG: ABC transporter permease [Dehalococcoidia bacterium]|nr:ABC transporter permease [Dehalococcoidia bacterium]